MKLYSEEKAGTLRASLEAEVKEWAGVRAKKMFGCPCFDVGGKLFAFVVNGGIVLTQLSEEQKGALARAGATPFRAAGRTVSAWVRVPVADEADLRRLRPTVRGSYERAKSLAGRRGT